jgi:hypothetical protein
MIINPTQVPADFWSSFFGFINQNILWFILVYMFHIGYKSKAEWVGSVRSIGTAMIVVLFVKLALTTLDPKDSMLIISLVFNFYYLVKQRSADNVTPTK